MSSFEDYFFKIPISENSKSDWDDIIENSDDDLKLLRIFQARVCLLVNLNNSQTIKVVIPASLSSRRREGGNPLQINNLVQVMDARLLGHDNIEVY